jgi:hypothetical protein
MATLNLVQTDSGGYLVQGSDDPTHNADFSLYSLDGEGGDPFLFGNQSWQIVEGVKSAEYDDTDSFWSALDAVLTSAKARGIKLPDYVV